MPSKKTFLKNVALTVAYLSSLTSQWTWAQINNDKESGKGVQVDSKLPLLIDFVYEQWNKNPNEADSAVLLIRNNQTNRVVKATLSEDGPNTNHFVGQFTITWDTDGPFQADIYSPPQQIAKQKGQASVEKMIKDGTLPRKPYFLRQERGLQKLSIFNSAEQALEAYAQYRQAMQGVQRPVQKPVVDKAALEAARNAELAAEHARLAKLAAEQELSRQQKEADERRKQEELKRQQESMAAAERQKRIDQAKALSQEALTLYASEKYIEAEPKFRSSIELDPSQTGYYFQYGATLYRNEKYNEALVALSMANDPSVNQREKAFFQGLCHTKLQEFAPALEQFSLVTSVTDDTLTPAASFYTGIIYFSKEKYPLAKAAFEQTLDTSKDPQMDAQAENYIEQIANIEQFQAKLAQRFTTTVNTGLMYDSNILMVSNSSSSTATDKEGFRGLLNAGLEYRMIYTETQELQAEASYTDMYSMDPSLKANSTLQMADPMVVTLKIPYKWKGQLMGKPYVLSVGPGYEILRLNVDGSGPRETTMNSTTLSTEQTFIVKEDYFTTIKLDWRGEDSKIESAGTADATKISLGNNNILFMDAKKTEAALLNWSYLINQTSSKDSAFNKLELSGGYLMPIMEKGSWTNVLALSQSTYSKSTTKRKDTNMNFTTSLTKPLMEKLQGALSLGYETNTSSVAASTYNKYTLSATVNYALDF
jgi:hypothetical protein